MIRPSGRLSRPSMTLYPTIRRHQAFAAMCSNTSIDTKVAQLIDRLVLPDRDQVQAATTALVMLGQPAVPAIIRRIDDRREMSAQGVAFENKYPGAFEAVAQYVTPKVVDRLNYVLNRLTGEDFSGFTAAKGRRMSTSNTKS